MYKRQLEQCIRESEIVFESTAENWEIKAETNKRIAEIAGDHLAEFRNTVFCTGTSGLSITELAKMYPEELRGNYLSLIHI